MGIEGQTPEEIETCEVESDDVDGSTVDFILTDVQKEELGVLNVTPEEPAAREGAPPEYDGDRNMDTAAAAGGVC